MRYIINGKKYPSVTEIIGQLDKSDALMKWAVRKTVEYYNKTHSAGEMPNDQTALNYFRESNNSLDIGSEVHGMIETYIKHGKTSASNVPEVQRAFNSFLKWVDDVQPQFLESEKPVVNSVDEQFGTYDYIGYAGTLDCLAVIDGKTYCIDFKTSAAIYPEYWMQIAAYKNAREEMKGNFNVNIFDKIYENNYDTINIDSLGILRLDKDSEIYEWKTITDENKIQRYWNSFYHLLMFYYEFKQRRL